MNEMTGCLRFLVTHGKCNLIEFGIIAALYKRYPNFVSANELTKDAVDDREKLCLQINLSNLVRKGLIKKRSMTYRFNVEIESVQKLS